MSQPVNDAAAEGPHVLNAHGIVVGTEHLRRVFGLSGVTVGGLSARVQRGEDVGFIVGLDTDQADGGLLLHVVWMQPGHTSMEDAQQAIHDYERGHLDEEPELVRAEGLVALDAYVPSQPDRRILIVEDEIQAALRETTGKAEAGRQFVQRLLDTGRYALLDSSSSADDERPLPYYVDDPLMDQARQQHRLDLHDDTSAEALAEGASRGYVPQFGTCSCNEWTTPTWDEHGVFEAFDQHMQQIQRSIHDARD